MKLKEIGVYFGIGESGACPVGRQVENGMKRDRRPTKKARRWKRESTSEEWRPPEGTAMGGPVIHNG
jgi:hypothetical protein